jgi:hypothetical protein
MSAAAPVPERKATYLGLAQQLLAASTDEKTRKGLQEIVDLLQNSQGLKP